MNAAIQLEEVGNDLAQSYDVQILCAYPLSSFPEEHTEAYERICAQRNVRRSYCASGEFRYWCGCALGEEKCPIRSSKFCDDAKPARSE